MIARIWSGESPLWRLLLPLSWLYGLVSGVIRLSYQLGWQKAWRAPVPVVVVGNLTAGGNGKTPVVIWLVEQLQQRGIRVGVVSRGYGGKADRYPLVLDDRTSTAQAGDEPVLIHQRTGAPVAVAPLRSDAVKALLSAHDLQMIVTDDGLLRPGMAVNLLTGERRDVSTFTNVVAMAGIGHPPRFFATLESCGVQPVKTVALADHQALSQADVAALVTADQTLLMTEKDAVKCRDFAAANWWYLPVDAIMADERAQRLLADLATLAQR